MNEIKSLADQLRHSMASKPRDNLVPVTKTGKKGAALKSSSNPAPLILQEILDYDASKNKAMVHVKLDEETARLLGHFKMATGIDNIKLVAFAVRHLFASQPELKTYIKNFILNFDL
ncbi:hypothetical protein [Pedobacter sp. GR22-6]|uniref:hypothetical protein n=1 Tax=Pedobacter sp. GR22-6 TaxID=3127957 RepID=UPI00307EB59D